MSLDTGSDAVALVRQLVERRSESLGADRLSRDGDSDPVISATVPLVSRIDQSVLRSVTLDLGTMSL
jgi:hypothetical protein